ncbi:bile acid:sodium symporter family protein [Carboxylicivirga sp. N1Y90]|uniref:bile acid:sodium symporter family protein n=1 Tax=Carboxylicivirga fragile TaxID=3417571 RepID=UPI003D341AE3|nr:bile acid:sodium symporter family protein [Marinilabiliaceae bacterium N1Y90]
MRKYFIITASVLILISLVLFITERLSLAPIFLISGIIGLAIFTNKIKFWGGFSFSLWILGAVVASLSYPEYFLSIGDFKTELLIVPLLQLIMFGMGSQMSLNDFAGVIKMPKGVLIGVVCQFTIMPVIGFSIAYIFKFPPEIAAGIILVGSSPSGMASNVMSFIAKANLALSVTLTAFATLLSPLMTPLMMKIFASEMVTINFLDMMAGIFNMVILPICAGLIFNLFAFGDNTRKTKIIQLLAYFAIIVIKNILNSVGGDSVMYYEFFKGVLFDGLNFIVLPIIVALAFKNFMKEGRETLNKILSFTSMFGIAVIIVVITAAGRDSLLEVGLMLILACLLHNTLGYGLGYSLSRLFGLKEQDCRTIALEVGMQNGGLASGLALQMGKVATVGLAPAVFGPLMNITGSTLASWWKNKVPSEKKK